MAARNLSFARANLTSRWSLYLSFTKPACRSVEQNPVRSGGEGGEQDEHSILEKIG